jgi:hypothetical protein
MRRNTKYYRYREYSQTDMCGLVLVALEVQQELDRPLNAVSVLSNDLRFDAPDPVILTESASLEPIGVAAVRYGRLLSAAALA